MCVCVCVYIYIYTVCSLIMHNRGIISFTETVPGQLYLSETVSKVVNMNSPFGNGL